MLAVIAAAALRWLLLWQLSFQLHVRQTVSPNVDVELIVCGKFP